MTWRPPDAEDRRIAALWAVCAGLALLLRPLWLAGAPYLPACLWRSWTGWPCPGCGSTRSIVSLLDGHVASALAWNPLAGLAAIVFIAGGLVAPLWLACGGRAISVGARPRPAILAAAAVVFVANWVWLFASGV